MMVRTAAILAGGFGTRLRSVVHDRPKVMAMVGGRPFVTRLLDQLAEGGIGRVVLCTGYMADVVRGELGDCYRNLELIYSVEESALGTGGALRLASAALPEGLLLVLNGDSFCDCGLAEFIAGHAANGAAAGMVLAGVADVSRFGAVRVSSESRVEDFTEKGALAGPGWINAGIYLIPVSRLREIPPDRVVSLEHEIIPRLIADGLFAYECDGAFIDIGIPEEYRRAERFFAQQQKGTS